MSALFYLWAILTFILLPIAGFALLRRGGRSVGSALGGGAMLAAVSTAVWFGCAALLRRHGVPEPEVFGWAIVATLALMAIACWFLFARTDSLIERRDGSHHIP